MRLSTAEKNKLMNHFQKIERFILRWGIGLGVFALVIIWIPMGLIPSKRTLRHLGDPNSMVDSLGFIPSFLLVVIIIGLIIGLLLYSYRYFPLRIDVRRLDKVTIKVKVRSYQFKEGGGPSEIELSFWPPYKGTSKVTFFHETQFPRLKFKEEVELHLTKHALYPLGLKRLSQPVPAPKATPPPKKTATPKSTSKKAAASKTPPKKMGMEDVFNMMKSMTGSEKPKPNVKGAQRKSVAQFLQSKRRLHDEKTLKVTEAEEEQINMQFSNRVKANEKHRTIQISTQRALIHTILSIFCETNIQRLDITVIPVVYEAERFQKYLSEYRLQKTISRAKLLDAVQRLTSINDFDDLYGGYDEFGFFKTPQYELPNPIFQKLVEEEHESLLRILSN